MKGFFLLAFLAFALPAWAQTMTATITFTDPNSGPQAVDRVVLDKSIDGGVTWGFVANLNPGVTTYQEVVTWSAQLCYRGIPENTAGQGPAASSCTTGTKIPPGQLQNFNVNLK